MIISDQRKKGIRGKYVVEYLTWFKGYKANSDEWLNSKQLRNAPEVLEVWHKKQKLTGPQYMWEIAFPLTRFYGISSMSPTSTSHHLQLLQHHSNQSPFAFLLFNHAYAIPHHCSTFFFLFWNYSFQSCIQHQCTPWHPRILFPYHDTKMPSHPSYLWNS